MARLPGDRRADQPPVLSQHRPILLPQRLDQPRRPLNIGEQERHRPARKPAHPAAPQPTGGRPRHRHQPGRGRPARPPPAPDTPGSRPSPRRPAGPPPAGHFQAPGATIEPSPRQATSSLGPADRTRPACRPRRRARRCRGHAPNGACNPRHDRTGAVPPAEYLRCRVGAGPARRMSVRHGIGRTRPKGLSRAAPAAAAGMRQSTSMRPAARSHGSGSSAVLPPVLPGTGSTRRSSMLTRGGRQPRRWGAWPTPVAGTGRGRSGAVVCWLPRRPAGPRIRKRSLRVTTIGGDMSRSWTGSPGPRAGIGDHCDAEE